jgi:hypothetical protein
MAEHKKNTVADRRTLAFTMPSFSIPWGWLLVIFAITVLLIAAFIWGPSKWHEGLIFAASVLASAALLLSAADALDARGSREALAQKIAALEYINKWNSPQFYHCKKNGRAVLVYFKAHSVVGEQVTYVEGDPEIKANLIDVLNHFEALYIGIRNHIVDDDISREFFRSIALQYWHLCEAYIKNRRAERNNPRLLCEFEALFESWKD